MRILREIKVQLMMINTTLTNIQDMLHKKLDRDIIEQHPELKTNEYYPLYDPKREEYLIYYKNKCVITFPVAHQGSVNDK